MICIRHCIRSLSLELQFFPPMKNQCFQKLKAAIKKPGNSPVCNGGGGGGTKLVGTGRVQGLFKATIAFENP